MNNFDLVEKIRKEFVEFSLYIAWSFGNVCGITGFWIVVLGYASDYQPGWIPDKMTFIATAISTVLTVFGATISVAAIWAPPNPRPPDKVTKKYTAPTILLMLMASTIYGVSNGGLNGNILNGIAMIGIATAVLRLLSQKPR